MDDSDGMGSDKVKLDIEGEDVDIEGVGGTKPNIGKTGLDKGIGVVEEEEEARDESTAPLN